MITAVIGAAVMGAIATAKAAATRRELATAKVPVLSRDGEAAERSARR